MRSFPRLESTVWMAERRGGWRRGGMCARACGERGGENRTFVWVTILFCVCVCVGAVEESECDLTALNRISQEVRPIQRDKKYFNYIRTHVCARVCVCSVAREEKRQQMS